MKANQFLISIVLSLCMIFLFPVQALAEENALCNLSSEDVVGIITAEDGSQYRIDGTIVENKQRSAEIGNLVTYAFAVPASLAAGGSTTIHDWDDGNASIVYLTINYDISDDGEDYLLLSVSGYWVIEDRYASVESAYLTYGCNCAYTFVNNQYASDVPVNNNFYVATGFSDYIPYDYGVMGANLTVNYLIGTSRRWSFTLSNVLFNNFVEV